MKRWGCCSSRSTRPGCEQRPARCSGFTLRTEGGAPTINTRLLRRSTRPGCEQRLARCSGFTLRTEGGAPTQHAPTVGAPAPGANNGRLGVLALPFAPRAVLLQSTRTSRVGAPAQSANKGWLGVLASPFAPRAVLLQSTRANRRSTRPGCEQRPARCSGFTLRTEG